MARSQGQSGATPLVDVVTEQEPLRQERRIPPPPPFRGGRSDEGLSQPGVRKASPPGYAPWLLRSRGMFLKGPRKVECARRP